MEKKLLISLINIINPREKPTVDRIRQVKARLKDYSSEELIASAKALSHSQWHIENGQMSIDNLIRPSKIGRWYALSDKYMNEITPSNQNDKVAERMK